MKKLFFIAIVLLSANFLTAQTVNDVPIKDIDVEYVQIVGTQKIIGNKVLIQIDFGQETKFFKQAQQSVLKDETGKMLDFNSMIDALNFMSANGYDFVSAYTISITNQNVYHYLLRKTKV